MYHLIVPHASTICNLGTRLEVTADAGTEAVMSNRTCIPQVLLASLSSPPLHENVSNIFHMVCHSLSMHQPIQGSSYKVFT